jgi:hypothetical protein
MAIKQPDLNHVMLPFEPVSYWAAGDYDPTALIAALKMQEGLADFTDTNGNVQSAIRLDRDTDPSGAGFWISVPEGTPEAVVDIALAAYVPPEPPAPPPPAAADAVLTALTNLDPKATLTDTVNTVKQALREAGAQPT